MQQNGKLLVSQSEKAVLETASLIKFGEMIDVEIVPGGEIQISVSEQQENFLKTLRAESETLFNLIMVHDGIPVQAQINGSAHGIRYLKKIRFS